MNKYIFIIFSFIFCQGLNTNIDYYDRLNHEIESINKKQVLNDLFIWPLVDNSNASYYDFFNKENNNFDIYPVAALRYSSTGFEMNKNIPYPVFQFELN